MNTVFQNYALFPHLSVEKNVAFGLKYRDVSKAEQSERVGHALELVRLTGVRGAAPEPAFRRAAAARRARPCADAPSRGALLLDETPRRPRREAAQGPQIEPKTIQEEVGINVHLRAARPGRSADDFGPHCGDVERLHRAGRPTANIAVQISNRAKSSTASVCRLPAAG
ncbi:MAG: hypothetical protein WD206_08050 [Actinomycetota bacterium]